MRFTGAPGFLLQILLSPFAALYFLVMAFRNRLYDFGLLKSYGFDTPIVSIGNLTVGGTGKTPLTALLVQACLDRNLRVAIVSRGYGSEIKEGWAQVPRIPSGQDATKYGDEPCWYAERFPEVPVFIGPKRSEVVRALLMPAELVSSNDEKPVGTKLGDVKFDSVKLGGTEPGKTQQTPARFARMNSGNSSAAKKKMRDAKVGKNKIDIIFADDAFQHRQLRRAMDIVVIDATQPRWHYHSLPLGRLREGFASLRRARLVFVTKCNLGTPEQLTWIHRQLSQSYPTPVVCTNAVITQFVDRQRKTSFSFSSSDRLLLVSGIGRPETFEKAVVQATPAQVAGHLIFDDHQKYDKQALLRIENEVARQKVDAIVMTEKDAVKLKEWAAKLPVAVAILETKVTEFPNVIEKDSPRRLKDFYEALDRLLR